MITYGSVCSGIESASVAWEPLGMTANWFSEIEPFPSAVLAHHWPNVPNLGDMNQLPNLIRSGLVPAPDILVGGTPCQAFSVAGLRAGLEDPRGQLTLTYVDILNAIDEQRKGREAVCVWENVPGVLSSKDNAFGCFLAALCGEDEELRPTGKKWAYAGTVFGPQRTVAWRTLDAQYFGVAQRRRRVFVVASARDGFDPTKVLFESESVRRDTPPSREAKTQTTIGVREGYTPSGFADYRRGCGTLKAKGGDCGGGSEVLVVHGTQDPDVTENLCHPVGRDGNSNVACFHQNSRDELRESEISGTLSAGGGKPGHGYAAARINSEVRRLTPVECERLQGFPDNHTKIPWRGKQPDDCPDGPRYKAIGNSKAVPVIRWVAKRLLKELR